MWAQVSGDVITAVSLDVPAGEGWVDVADVERPDDTDEHTWDAGVALVGGMPVQAWTARPWTDAEWARVPAERRDWLRWVRRRAELRETVVGGLAALASARAAAEGDVSNAETLRTQALALADELITLTGQVTAFSPAATYSQAQMLQVRAALVSTLTRMTQLVQAMAELYAYRRANNQDAVLAHRSLEFVARYLFGDVP